MFAKALYYPWIDIADDNWLKTAILYWDEISTIVPESIENPYENQAARIAQAANILKPLHVNSYMREVKEIAPEVITYMNTDEGLKVLLSNPHGHDRIHPEKLSYELRSRFGDRIHPDKLHHELKSEIRRGLLSAKVNNDGWFETSTAFANYYMTLLANKISAMRGVALVSDYNLYDQLTLKIRNGREADYRFNECPECGAPARYERVPYRPLRKCEHCGTLLQWHYVNGVRLIARKNDIYGPNLESIADGLLAQIALKKVAIRSDIGIDKIIDFKINNEKSLKIFRGALSKLVQALYDSNNIESLQALQERLNSIYINEVSPSIDDIKSQLKANAISTIMADFSLAGMSSIVGLGLGATSTTSVYPHLGNYAILAGAGISVVAMSVLYNQRKNQILRSPYSYVLSVERELGYGY